MIKVQKNLLLPRKVRWSSGEPNEVPEGSFIEDSDVPYTELDCYRPTKTYCNQMKNNNLLRLGCSNFQLPTHSSSCFQVRQRRAFDSRRRGHSSRKDGLVAGTPQSSRTADGVAAIHPVGPRARRKRKLRKRPKKNLRRIRSTQRMCSVGRLGCRLLRPKPRKVPLRSATAKPL